MRKPRSIILLGTMILISFLAFLYLAINQSRKNHETQNNVQIASQAMTTPSGTNTETPSEIELTIPSKAQPADQSTEQVIEQDYPRVIRKRGLSTDVVARSPKPEELVAHSLLRKKHWYIWQNLSAQPKGVANDSASTSASSSGAANTKNQFPEVSGYWVVENQNAQASLDQFELERPVVLYNQRTQQIGVLTGTLKIVIQDNSEIANVLRDHDLRIVQSFPEIQTHLLSSAKQSFSLAGVFSALQTDSRIKYSELEILSRRYEKR